MQTVPELSSIVAVGPVFSNSSLGSVIRSSALGLTCVGHNTLVFETGNNRPEGDLDHLTEARDMETFSPDFGIGLHFLDADWNGAVPTCEGPQYGVLAHPFTEVGAPTPPNIAEGLHGFTGLLTLTRAITEDLNERGFSPHFVGQAFETPDTSYLPARTLGIADQDMRVLLTVEPDTDVDERTLARVGRFILALLDAPKSRPVHIAVLMPGLVFETLPVAQDPRVKFFNTRTTNTFTEMSLINAAHCVVSLDAAPIFARAAGRAIWHGVPVILSGSGAHRDLLSVADCLVDEYDASELDIDAAVARTIEYGEHAMSQVELRTARRIAAEPFSCYAVGQRIASAIGVSS